MRPSKGDFFLSFYNVGIAFKTNEIYFTYQPAP